MTKFMITLAIIVLIVLQTINAHHRHGNLQDHFQPPVPYESCCFTRGFQTDPLHNAIDIVCGLESVGVVAMGDGDVVGACDGQAEGPDYSVCGQGVTAKEGTRIKKSVQVGMTGNIGNSGGIHLDVTSQTNPGPDGDLYDPTSVVDFRKMLEMDHWKHC